MLCCNYSSSKGCSYAFYGAALGKLCTCVGNCAAGPAASYAAGVFLLPEATTVNADGPKAWPRYNLFTQPIQQWNACILATRIAAAACSHVICIRSRKAAVCQVLLQAAAVRALGLRAIGLICAGFERMIV